VRAPIANAALDALGRAASSSGTVQAEARHPHFATREVSVSLRPDEPTWLGDVVLVAGASIAGRVEGTGAGVAVWAYLGPDRKVARRQYPGARPMLQTDGSVTSLVDKLEEKGLVPRERATDDRRMVTVQLTPAGRRLITKVLPQHLERIVAAFAARMPRKARKA
jgi:hypothetical protein